MTPLIITVAGIGAELTKKDTPYLPTSLEEIVAEAKAVAALGAQVFHLHVRDQKGQPTCDAKIISKTVRAIKKHTDLIIQISTGGAIDDTVKDRVGTLVKGVDMGSLTLGSVNFGNDVFLNPRPLISKLAATMQKKNIRPELEIFDVGMAEQAHWLIKKGLITPPYHFNILLGGPGWLAADKANIEFILKKLPKGSTWSASGVGRHQQTMTTYAIKHKGHVRTGLEDNIYLKKGELAKSNAALVEKVIGQARRFKRRLASLKEAKKILGVS